MSLWHPALLLIAGAQSIAACGLSIKPFTVTDVSGFADAYAGFTKTNAAQQADPVVY